MATLAGPEARAQSEERFFFRMACTIAVLIVAGFGFQLGAGRSTFAVPLVFHLHAFVFFGWVALFVCQSGLVAADNVALHRKLGWLSVVWLPLMVVMGIIITITSMQRSGGPFFFDANEFMISNVIGLLAFAGMISTAIIMRRRTDWHRRLIMSAMAAILGPAFGRLMPMPLLIPSGLGWEISNVIGLIFILVGMAADKRRHGAVHPAWMVGLAVGFGWIALGQVLSYQPWAIELTKSVMAGHPGAARPMEAYLP